MNAKLMRDMARSPRVDLTAIRVAKTVGPHTMVRACDNEYPWNSPNCQGPATHWYTCRTKLVLARGGVKLS
jgi:hypothetical protein